jgi:hypothetical protein
LPSPQKFVDDIGQASNTDWKYPSVLLAFLLR